MADQAIYSSTAPEVLEAWAETQRRYREYHQRAREFFARFPDHEGLQTRFSDSVRVIGLRGSGKPGEGWRRSKDGDWFPDKRTKAGKVLAKNLADLSVKGLGHLPGMPDMIISHGRWYSHSAREVKGVMWVRWGIGHDEVEHSETFSRGFNVDLWQRAKASAYYLAMESVDDSEVAS